MAFGIPYPETPSIFEAMILADSGEAILGSFVLFILIGVVVAWFSQTRIKYYRKVKIRVKERKLQAKHLLVILDGLARTSAQIRVRELLGKRLLDIIEDIMDINPVEPGVKIIYDAAEKLMKIAPKQTVYDTSVADNDNEVRHLQNLLLAAIAQIKKMPRRGFCTYSEANELEQHLKMVYVQVEIDAHMFTAELAAEAGDRNLASNHYRIAQNKLAHSKYHGKEKRQAMADIGKTIRGLFSIDE